MSAGFQQAIRSTGGSSAMITMSGPTTASSRPKSNLHPRRGSMTGPHKSSTIAMASDHTSQQKTEQRKPQHNGVAASTEPEPRYPSQVSKSSVSALSNKAGPSNSKIPMHPAVRDPAAETSMKKTQALSKEGIDGLSSTFRKFVLKDKVAIVTGGARGLGLSMAQALCESGIKAVAIFDIQAALGESMAQSLNSATDIPVKYYNVDVTNENNVESAVRQVVQQFGGIDILINSAGVAFSNLPAETHGLDVFQKTININLVGSFCVARAVARHMIAATPKSLSTSNPHLPDRSIIFIASMSGTIVNYPQPQCAYNASKAGVIQLSKCLAAEWAKYGIRVNTVSPGYMDTVLNKTPALNQQKKIWKERTPLGRLGDVDELGNVVVWLAGEGSRFCTGSDVKVDGGYSIY